MGRRSGSDQPNGLRPRHTSNATERSYSSSPTTSPATNSQRSLPASGPHRAPAASNEHPLAKRRGRYPQSAVYPQIRNRRYLVEQTFDNVYGISTWVSAAAARERISAALDAIDAAHEVLRDTPSDLVGSDFRVDVAARLEAQERTNRGLMYRILTEIADPPDETGSFRRYGTGCGRACGSLQGEITRRFKLAARIRPRRSLTETTIARGAACVGCSGGGRWRWRGPHSSGVPSGRRAARQRLAP